MKTDRTLLQVFISIVLFTQTSQIMIAQNNDFRKMIEAAVKAPSGHNTQPWKFKIADSQIEIIPDLTKTLNVVDPDNRELYISIGCATENLLIAATNLGYKSSIQITDNGSIVCQLKKSGIVPDSLLLQIDRRQTNRSVYNSETIEDSILQLCLQTIPKQNKISVYNWKKESSQFEIIKQQILAGNSIQMEDDRFKTELKSWMRYNKKEAEQARDGLSYDVYGAPNLPKFISKPIMSSYLNSKKQNKTDLKKIESSSHFVLFTTTDNQIDTWITLGMYMQQFLLRMTQENIAHSYMNQPCEVKSSREELSTKLLPDKEIPQIILRIGYSKNMPYARRKAIDDVIIEN